MSQTCGFLAQAEVAAAVGEPVASGHPTISDPTVCEFDYADPSDPGSNLAVTIATQVDPTRFASLCHGSSLAMTTIVPASGVGDDARYSEGSDVAELDVMSGARIIAVTVAPRGGMVGSFPVTRQESIEKTLALAALAP
jgi:hypothetical protein